MEIGGGRIAAAFVADYLLALGHGAFALLLGAATGRRAAAIGIAAAVAVAGYLLDALAQVVEALEPWQVLSPFEYVGEPLRHGLQLTDAAVLIALALGAAAFAPPLFDRRDLAV